jgi:hypothetical protein
MHKQEAEKHPPLTANGISSRDKISSRTVPCLRHRYRILAVATPTVDARYFVAILFV